MSWWRCQPRIVLRRESAKGAGVFFRPASRSWTTNDEPTINRHSADLKKTPDPVHARVVARTESRRLPPQRAKNSAKGSKVNCRPSS